MINENDVVFEMVYGVVLQPLTVAIKELRYRGFTETMLRDLVSVAVDKGLTAYEEERTKSNAGH